MRSLPPDHRCWSATTGARPIGAWCIAFPGSAEGSVFTRRRHSSFLAQRKNTALALGVAFPGEDQSFRGGSKLWPRIEGYGALTRVTVVTLSWIKNAWSGYPKLVAGAWSRTSVTWRV